MQQCCYYCCTRFTPDCCSCSTAETRVIDMYSVMLYMYSATEYDNMYYTCSKLQTANCNLQPTSDTFYYSVYISLGTYLGKESGPGLKIHRIGRHRLPQYLQGGGLEVRGIPHTHAAPSTALRCCAVCLSAACWSAAAAGCAVHSHLFVGVSAVCHSVIRREAGGQG